MKHKRYIELLQRYIDGNLNPDEIKIVKNHLNICITCQKRLSVWEEINKLVRQTKIVKVPDDFTQKVLERVSMPIPIYERIKKPFIPLLNLRWAAVTIVAILLLITPLILRRMKPSVPSVVKVHFEIKIPEARVVSLVGDFNGWDINASRLSRKNGIWNIELSLRPGRYQYMFVVDDFKWIPDSRSTKFIEDGYGNKNSILDISSGHKLIKSGGKI